MTDLLTNSLLIACVSVTRNDLLQGDKKFKRLGLHTFIYVVIGCLQELLFKTEVTHVNTKDGGVSSLIRNF
jgi:hypothetical protein